MLAVENYMDVEGLPFHNGGAAEKKDFYDFLNTSHIVRSDARQKAADVEAMRDITKRIRKQMRFIVHTVRCWRERHGACDNSVRLRYSAYEGALCYTDLRRHWAYYRHAMKELESLSEA